MNEACVYEPVFKDEIKQEENVLSSEFIKVEVKKEEGELLVRSDGFDIPTYELYFPSEKSFIEQFQYDDSTSTVQEILPSPQIQNIPDSEPYKNVESEYEELSSRREVTDELPKSPECPLGAVPGSNILHDQPSTSTVKLYKCCFCSFSTGQKSQLDAHQWTHLGAKRPDLKTVHPIVRKSHQCSQCSYSTFRKAQLTSHQWTHGDEKPHKCSRCSYRTSQKSQLTSHRLIHVLEKPYKCSQCSYSARRKSQLTSHQWTHVDEKPFKCSQCSYSTSTQKRLNSHHWVHSDEKPYKCSKCFYSASQKASLVTHELSHSSSLNPYRCSECSFSSCRKSTLVRHQQVHSDGKQIL